MNVFNRMAMILILLVFIIAVLLISLEPRVVIEAIRLTLTAAERSLDPGTQLVGAILGLVVAAAASLLLLVELMPRKRHTVVVAQTDGDRAEVMNDSVALRVRRSAEVIPGVREVVPTIHSRGKALDVGLRLLVDTDADLPKKQEEVRQAVRAEVEARMGIQVKSVRVTFRHASQESRLPRLPGIGSSKAVASPHKPDAAPPKKADVALPGADVAPPRAGLALPRAVSAPPEAEVAPPRATIDG